MRFKARKGKATLLIINRTHKVKPPKEQPRVIRLEKFKRHGNPALKQIEEYSNGWFSGTIEAI